MFLILFCPVHRKLGGPPATERQLRHDGGQRPYRNHGSVGLWCQKTALQSSNRQADRREFARQVTAKCPQRSQRQRTMPYSCRVPSVQWRSGLIVASENCSFRAEL